MANPPRTTDTQVGQTLLAGHALMHKGTPYTRPGSMGPGRAKCECGMISPYLPSTMGRKEWHRHHKKKVLEEQAKDHVL